MRTFTYDDIVGILSKEHRLNTAWALAKHPDNVTADELVIHWVKFHPMTVHKFRVVGGNALLDHRQDMEGGDPTST